MNESSQLGVSRLATGAVKERLSEAVHQFTRRSPNALAIFTSESTNEINQ